MFSRAGQHVKHEVNSIKDRSSTPTGEKKKPCMHSEVQEELRMKVPDKWHKKRGNPGRDGYTIIDAGVKNVLVWGKFKVAGVAIIF